ncbi:MAG: riboflavin synthase [Bacteriovoracaceae bacterium]|jgi:riboflavin synthase|nr:riboflavin synthase [Bacteriovoracaceae bacterium]
MFTGLVKDIGKIVQIKPNKEGKVFVIESNMCSDIGIDDSVSTNGVCLTATSVTDKTFTVQAIHVTLEKTNLGKLTVGSKVNLELALRATDRLGGHIVQGHVNGTGHITKIENAGKNYNVSFTTEEHLKKYIIKEGSIAIDGTSLTIAYMDNSNFTVSLIPHTFDNTIFHTKKVGDSINIEVDIMAKYLEHFMKFDTKKSNLENLIKDW